MLSANHIGGLHGFGARGMVMLGTALLGMTLSPAGGFAQNAKSMPAESEAPVISAPAETGRASPDAASGAFGSDTPMFNSFAATDASPPMEGYNLNQNALPVVVELFTSQGCSSCPPADAMLSQLAKEPGVLPLSYHVDYWDYLGWKDVFAQPEFTERQELYARAAGERSVYTPQLIIDGSDTAVSPGPAQIMALIDANRASPAMVSVQRETTDKGQAIEVMPLSDLAGTIDVVLIRYAPKREVEMTAGENRGKVVAYTNVVLGVEELAEWDGRAPLRMTVKTDAAADNSMPEDTRHVLLVQRESGPDEEPGQILAAIPLD